MLSPCPSLSVSILRQKSIKFFKLGVLLSHTVVFVSATLLTKLLNVKNNGNNSSSIIHDPQTDLLYRVNYMVNVETYYVSIFVHSTTCVVFYTLLMITFDVLYLTLVQHCCGLFAALRSV